MTYAEQFFMKVSTSGIKKAASIMARFGFLACAASVFFIVPSANAVVLEAQDMKFGINGYLDMEYTYLGKMPMVMTDEMSQMQMIMTKNDESYFEQRHMNLIFGAEKDRFRAHVNLGTLHAFSTQSEGVRDFFSIHEAYGEYLVSDQLKVRAGQFLCPFGLLNEIRYITPLFEPVVLPSIYLPDSMYTGDPIINAEANLMVSGVLQGNNSDLFYAVHVGNGNREDDGAAQNKNKQIGGRLRLTLAESFNVGASILTVENDTSTADRKLTYGGDIDFSFFNDDLNLQAEYVKSDFKTRGDKMSYYVKLTYNVGNFSPFIVYDYFRDSGDILYESGAKRIGVGSGYKVSDNIVVKGEVHFHEYPNAAVSDEAKHPIMLKTSMIFFF